jgi:hypothetical protein
MRNLIIGLLAGLFVGLVLAGSVSTATAQNPTRIYGTSSTGAAVPIAATSGSLHVACQ